LQEEKRVVLNVEIRIRLQTADSIGDMKQYHLICGKKAHSLWATNKVCKIRYFIISEDRIRLDFNL